LIEIGLKARGRGVWMRGEVELLKIEGQLIQGIPPAAFAAARIGPQLTVVLSAKAAVGERVGSDADELGQIILPNPRLLGANQ
jgi:hypothetical protein